MEAVAERRPLLIGAVSLIPRLRLKRDGAAVIPVRDEMRAAMEANGYMSAAPFKTVSLIFRYGDRENLEPEAYDIDRATECLNIAVHLDGRALVQLSESELREKFRTALIEVLCDVAANFDLPYEFLDAMRHEV